MRALLGALAGACAALLAVAAFTLSNPAIVLDMDVNVPRPVTAGFHGVERVKDETFAWTTQRATVTLRGLDRDAEWVCTAKLRGARPPGLPAAQVTMSVDGITAATHTPGEAYEDVSVAVPRKPGGSSAVVTISTTPPYVPPSDPRELGVMVDEFRCAPAAGWIMPPRAAVLQAAIAGAVFGALFALASGSLLAVTVAILMFSTALGLLLTTGVASYSRSYLEWVLPTVLGTAGATGALAALAARRRRALHPATAFMLGFSAAVLCLKTLALLHPSKEVVDAAFHAHRLEWVLGGRYYFTQQMPGGVQFPYAIGLYLVAAPWAALLPDHVALLRIVVAATEAIAAGLLYVAVVRAWGDRLAGAAAVVLYHAAPLSYPTIGNANLTFAFGQSIAVMAVAAATIWTFERRVLLAGAGLFALAALAFLSHVGVFPLVGLTLLSTGLLYAAAGGPELRRASWTVIAASVLAALFAVGSYYAHFPEVYRTLDRVRAPAMQPQAPTGSASTPPLEPIPLSERGARAARLALDAYGVPLLVLALAGAVRLRGRPRDRLTLALGGWGISCAVFLVFRILAPVDPRLQRYADEFIHRVYGMTLPAVAILAACGATWAWRKNAAWGLVALVLSGAAVVNAIGWWLAWFR